MLFPSSPTAASMLAMGPCRPPRSRRSARFTSAPRTRTAKDDVRGWGPETRLHAPPPPLRAPPANYLGKGGDAWVMPLPRQSTHINSSCIFKLREGKQAGVTTHATFSQLQSLRVMVDTFSMPPIFEYVMKDFIYDVQKYGVVVHTRTYKVE